MVKLYHWDVETPAGRQFHLHTNPPMSEAEVLGCYPGSKVTPCCSHRIGAAVNEKCCLPKG